MLVCHSCQRHYRAADGRCPFCGTGLQTTPAPSLGMTAALVLGLAMFACNKEGDEADSSGGSEDEATQCTMGTGTEGMEATEDSGGADYAGPTEEGFDTETGIDTTTSTDDTGTADYGGPDTTGTDTTDTTDTTDSGTADYGGAPVPDPEIEL